jgi:hypothetical protein
MGPLPRPPVPQHGLVVAITKKGDRMTYQNQSLNQLSGIFPSQPATSPSLVDAIGHAVREGLVTGAEGRAWLIGSFPALAAAVAKATPKCKECGKDDL